MGPFASLSYRLADTPTTLNKQEIVLVFWDRVQGKKIEPIRSIGPAYLRSLLFTPHTLTPHPPPPSSPSPLSKGTWESTCKSKVIIAITTDQL